MNVLDLFGANTAGLEVEDVTNPKSIVVDKKGDVYQDGKLIKKGEDVKNIKKVPLQKNDKDSVDLTDASATYKSIVEGLPPLPASTSNKVVFDDFMKNRLGNLQFKKDMEAEQKRLDNLGFFGKMMETLKTDADAREKFFDQLGTIGGEISRPTDPGEARSLARDLIVGSQKGQGLTAAKAKAEAENLAQIAKARKDANPLQFASSSYKQALEAANAMVQQGKLSPNTPEYFAFIEDRMTSLGLGSQVTSIMSAITQAQEKLVFLEDETQRSNMENLINNLQNEIFNILGGSSSAGTSQTQKDFMNEIDATQN
jgi:hypothetical protein|tara:strand:+ start:245 stop:1183 length:939 start_codon:yes stop_codon:yes gene_type:complete